MDKLIFKLYVLFVFTCVSCSTETSPENARADKIENNPDTILSSYSNDFPDLSILSSDSIYFIGDSDFRFFISAQLDTSDKIQLEEYEMSEGKIHKNSWKGFNANYKIIFMRSNGEAVFTTIFSKKDFETIAFPSDVLLSNPSLPQPRGFLSKFNAFLFVINFARPDSDLLSQCLFMVDTTGKIFRKEFIADGMDENYNRIEISPDSSWILTPHDIIHADGRIIEYGLEEEALLYYAILNNKHFLCLTLYNDSHGRGNALIMNDSGDIIRKFVYRGEREIGLGYTIPRYFDSITDKLYLLDQTQKHLRIIPRNRPMDHYMIAFDQFKKYSEVKPSNHIRFMISSDSMFYFSVDTTKELIQWKRQRY